MIFSQSRDWQTKVYEDDGNVIIQHTTDNTAIAEQAKFLRENTDRGFTADRQMQCVGYIPFDLFYKEQLHLRPIEDAFKFLETSEAARPFRIAPKNTGNTGRVVIK